MPSSTMTKFQGFGLATLKGTHNFTPSTGHTFKYYLTNTAPDAANDFVKADLPAEITAAGGYTAGGVTVAVAACAQSGGVAKVTMSDVTLTAAGANIGPFRYAVLYNDSAANEDLVGFYDYGTSVTILDGENFVFDADGSAGAFTLT